MDLTTWWLKNVCGMNETQIQQGRETLKNVEKEEVAQGTGNWKKVYWIRFTHLFSSQETLNNKIVALFTNKRLQAEDLHWFSDSTIISLLPKLKLTAADVKSAILSASAKTTKIALAAFMPQPQPAARARLPQPFKQPTHKLQKTPLAIHGTLGKHTISQVTATPQTDLYALKKLLPPSAQPSQTPPKAKITGSQLAPEPPPSIPSSQELPTATTAATTPPQPQPLPLPATPPPLTLPTDDEEPPDIIPVSTRAEKPPTSGYVPQYQFTPEQLSPRDIPTPLATPHAPSSVKPPKPELRMFSRTKRSVQPVKPETVKGALSKPSASKPSAPKTAVVPRARPEIGPEHYFKNVAPAQFMKNLQKQLVDTMAPWEDYLSYLAENFHEWHQGEVAAKFDAEFLPYAKLYIYERPELRGEAQLQLERNITANVKNFTHPRAQREFLAEIQERIGKEKKKDKHDSIKIRNYEGLQSSIKAALAPPPGPSPYPAGMQSRSLHTYEEQPRTVSSPKAWQAQSYRATAPSVPEGHIMPSKAEKKPQQVPPLPQEILSAANIQIHPDVTEKELARATGLKPPDASRVSLEKEVLFMPINENDIARLYETTSKGRKSPPYRTRVDLALALASERTAQIQEKAEESGLTKPTQAQKQKQVGKSDLAKPADPVRMISELYIWEKLQLYEEMYGHANCQRFKDDLVKDIRKLLSSDGSDQGKMVLAYLYVHMDNKNLNYFDKTLGEAYRSILMEFQSEKAVGATAQASQSAFIPPLEQRREHVRKKGEEAITLPDALDADVIRNLLVPKDGIAFIDDIRQVAGRLNKLFYADKSRFNKILDELPLKAKLYLYETINPGFRPVGVKENEPGFDTALLSAIENDCRKMPAEKAALQKYLRGTLANGAIMKKYPDIKENYELLSALLA